jgi:Circularly permutated YpsA SLOG family
MIKNLKVISGGQTGCDLAGLKAAKDFGLETGGTAPKGYLVTNPDGSIGTNPNLKHYGLVEHTSPQFPPRTIQNVRNSCVTFLFGDENSRGSKLAIRTAKIELKPILINFDSLPLFQYCMCYRPKVINIAGNRQKSSDTVLGDTVYETLIYLFKLLDKENYGS